MPKTKLTVKKIARDFKIYQTGIIKPNLVTLNITTECLKFHVSIKSCKTTLDCEMFVKMEYHSIVHKRVEIEQLDDEIIRVNYMSPN